MGKGKAQRVELLGCLVVALWGGAVGAGEGYTYRGRTVTRAWMGSAYRAFQDKIAHVDGEWRDIGKAKLSKPGLMQTPPDEGKGAARLPSVVEQWRGRDAHARVMEKVADGEAILRVPAGRGADLLQEKVTFHLKGLDTSKHLVGAYWHGWMLYVGFHKWGGREVQSFAVYEPLSKEQFAACLASGFVLRRYKVVKMRPKGKAMPYMPPPTTREKVVSREVR